MGLVLSGPEFQNEAMSDLLATLQDALAALDRAWPTICDECLQVPGGERQYQAVIYHALRSVGGVPNRQLAMNVRQFIQSPKSKYFKTLQGSSHKSFLPTLDIVMLQADAGADRRTEISGKMILAIKVVAPDDHQRRGKRIRANEVLNAIRKLAGIREEMQQKFAKREVWSNRIENRGRPTPRDIRIDPNDPDAFTETVTITTDVQPVIVVVDTARNVFQRMAEEGLLAARAEAKALDVQWRYVSPAGCEVA